MPTEIVDHSGSFELRRRGEQFEILEDGILLLGTYGGESETRLVMVALENARAPHRVLLGSLGVGYSLGAALSLPGVERVMVVGTNSALIAWNRTYLAPFSGNGLADPRTQLLEGSLAEALEQVGQRSCGAICLEVEQGLIGLLPLLKQALAPGGVLAIWSTTGPEAELEAGLRQLFDAVESRAIAQGAAEPDYIYIARCQ